MNGREFTQPDGEGIVYPEEVGAGPADPRAPRGVTTTRTPVTRTGPTRTYRTPLTPLRKIGASPAGFLDSVKNWWGSLKKEYRYGIVGGLGLLGVIIAAVQKGEGKSRIGKV